MTSRPRTAPGRLSGAIAISALVFGCGGGDSAAPDAGGDVDAPADPDAGPGAALSVVLSFDGETLSSGAADDPDNNSTPLITGDPVTFTFDESVMDTNKSRAEIIADITAAVEAQFSAFDVDVRSDRPANAPYVLVVFGGQGNDVGNPSAVNLGLLDCDNSNGFSAIALVLTDQPGALDNLTYAEQVARTGVFAAQAVSFGLGLETVTDCPDTMANPFSCAGQMFTDADITCGIDSPEDCFCGGTTQNSVQRLDALL